MTSAQQSEGRPRLPKLRIEDPETLEEDQTEDDLITPRAHRPTVNLPSISCSLPTRTRPRVSRKRSVGDSELSGSDIETDDTMSSKSSSKHQSGSSSHSGKKHASSKSKSKAIKTDDWTEVTEPDERRRIQNRIAQRKFREKARENKERDERVANNLEHADNIYRIPKPQDLGDEPEEDLPWGSFSIRHVMARGHEAESRRSSGRDGEYLRDDSRTLSPGGYPEYPISRQPASYGSSGGGEEPPYFEGPSPYFYDYDYDQTGGPSQKTGDDANIVPFGYQSWLQPEPPLPSDPFGPYDTASPGSSSSASSRDWHGMHGRII